jgi:hypothetical protein
MGDIVSIGYVQVMRNAVVDGGSMDFVVNRAKVGT